MVRALPEDLERPVHLLQRQHAREAVGQGQPGERPDEARLLAHLFGEAFVAADAEGDLRGAADAIGQLLGGDFRAALVQRPQLAADLAQQLARLAGRVRCFELKRFELAEALEAPRVLLRQLRRRPLVLADREQPDFQESTSMRGASAQRPSRS